MIDTIEEKLAGLIANAKNSGRMQLRNELAKMLIAAEMVDAAKLVIRYPIEEPSRTKACGQGRG